MRSNLDTKSSKKKFILIGIIIIFVFVVIGVCYIYLKNKNMDIRQLKWHMSLEEVKAKESGNLIAEKPMDDIDDSEIEELGGGVKLIYEDIDFKGYSAEMRLYIYNKTGLSNIEYIINEDVYQPLYDIFYNEYGEPDENCDYGFMITSNWNKPTDKYSISLAKMTNSETNNISTYCIYMNPGIKTYKENKFK